MFEEEHMASAVLTLLRTGSLEWNLEAVMKLQLQLFFKLLTKTLRWWQWTRKCEGSSKGCPCNFHTKFTMVGLQFIFAAAEINRMKSWCWSIWYCSWALYCNYNLFSELPWAGDREAIFRPSSQAAICPSVYRTRWREEDYIVHTVLFIAEVQAGKLWTLIFTVFGLVWSGIEPVSTVSVANALFTGPLIGFLVSLIWRNTAAVTTKKELFACQKVFSININHKCGFHCITEFYSQRFCIPNL